jgi:signal transduction histidine kinase
MHDQMRGLQLQLIEAEKAKSIARLAAGVAHEVKNPLAIISMGIEFLSARFGADETATKVLHELGDAVQRADSVIKGLLDFSVPKQLTLSPNNINGIIRSALVLVRGEMKPGLHKITLALGEVPPVSLDPGKISQIFVNIFTNALHAMEHGGTLAVETRTGQVMGVGSNIGGQRSEVFQAGDRVVIVEVRDDGPGISPENIARIFDPFFTTKPTGKGTGLGMTVVKSIIDLHGGTIAIGNRPEGGTLVRMTFKS